MDAVVSFVVSCVREDLLPFLKEVTNTIRDVPNEVRKMEARLESIQAFIHGADRIVADEKEKNKQDEIKKKVKQLAQVAFQIEDVIDEYNIYKEQQSRDGRCATLARRAAAYLIRRRQISKKITSIKSQLNEIKESSNRDNDFLVQFSLEQGAGSSSTGNLQDVTWLKLREAPLYMKETEIVGFEASKDKLVAWLMKGRAERTVISVVGMGGLGKTTLAKKVFDNHQVIQNFDHRVWITVSQSYNVEGLLRDLLKALFQKEKNPPQNISTMDRRSLIDKVRNYLAEKRYFILFDDVWHENFWDEMNLALVDNEIGSRMLITTRNMPVVTCCKKSSFVEIHELQPLSEAESWELFCKKAFQFEFDGCCPHELQHISSEIVEKCGGLPLAIVAIGGLLSSKQKTRLEWEEFYRNLSLELEKNPDLADITKILGFSYNDLPFHLKSCFLHFGIYPEDEEIEVQELIRQFIAEGFAKYNKEDKSLEEVAEQYLRELIGRSLVQVSSFTIEGRARRCRVHDLLREMILRKIEDLRFCHVISSEDNEPALDGIIRRLSITTNSNDFVRTIQSPHLRSLYAFTNKDLPEYFVMNIPNKYRLLKVLHLRIKSSYGLNVPENLGNLIQLKYLSFRGMRITGLPKSIGNLENLESLNLWGTKLRDVPKEITKLRKLRHLYVNELAWIEGKDGIGGMTSLQTLCKVIIRGDEQVKELENLEQLRKLWVRIEDKAGKKTSICFSKMKHLEALFIEATVDLQLQCNSSPPPRKLQELNIEARLGKLPEWFLKLQNLLVLDLRKCELSEDPLPSLKNMSSLLFLCLGFRSYVGETLHFQDGQFQKLRELKLEGLKNLKSIIIDRGALLSLQKLSLLEIFQLKAVPAGIQHLNNLQLLLYSSMSPEFRERISAEGGQDHWIVNHVPLVRWEI